MAKATLGYGKRRLITEIIKKTWETENPEDVKLSYTDVLYIIQEMEDEEGKKYLEEDYSMRRGHHVFKEFTKQLLYRNLANYDSMVLITSEKGSGKSSSAIMMARLWCQLIGIRFDANRHMAYTNQDVMNKIDTLNKFEPMICVPGNTYIRIRRDGCEKNEVIKNLVGKDDYEVLSYNIKNDIFEWKKPKKTIYTKEDTIDTIELENGIKIQSTSNHLFLTKQGIYKKVSELTEQDELVIYTKKCINCNKEFHNHNKYVKNCSNKCTRQYNIKNCRKYQKNNRYKINITKKIYHDNKIKNNITYRLKHNILTRLRKYKELHCFTNKQLQDFMGCTYIELKNYLQSKFDKNMSWDNYGLYWSVDHIIPLTAYNLNNIKEVKKCLHYANIQPLENNLNSGKGRWYKC